MNKQSKIRLLGLGVTLAAALPLGAAPSATQPAAQTNLTATAAVANRYLLIVETSRAMKSRGDGTLNEIQDLLASGMRGQLQKGDTLGLWTFNSGVKAGVFPLQEWSPQMAKTVTTRVLQYLQDQRCEDQARLDPVMLLVGRLVKNSDYITIVLATTGQQKIQGTPFDDAINQTFKSWSKQQSAAHMPFITILRAEKGHYADYKVTQAPWRPELPALPPTLLAARAAISHPVPPPHPVAARPRIVVPNLIVSGRKHPAAAVAPASPAQPESAALTAKSEAPRPNPEPPLNNEKTALANASVLTGTKEPTEPVRTQQAEPAANPSSLAHAQAVSAAVSSPAPVPAAEASSPASAVKSEPDATGAEREEATLAAQSFSAEALPGKSFLRTNYIWLSALAGATVTLGLMWLLRGRTRAVAQTSLITRSFDQRMP